MNTLIERTAKLILLVILVAATGCQNESEFTPESENLGNATAEKGGAKSFIAELSSVNNTGVTGTATFVLDGNMLEVSVVASGLEPNRTHTQYIQGSAVSNKKSSCPSMTNDENGDNIVDFVEGLKSYGPILQILPIYPIADANGNISYNRTFTLGTDNNITTQDLNPFTSRVLVLYGLTIANEYKTNIPVACGEIRGLK